ncbi:MAG: SDR family NAD(P)-dependent oxidoreductase [Puia sp.]
MAGSYSVSKFALTGFSKNLREELKAYSIKVTCVIRVPFIPTPGPLPEYPPAGS